MEIVGLLLRSIADIWIPLASGKEPMSRQCYVCPRFRETKCYGCPVLRHLGDPCIKYPTFKDWVAVKDTFPSPKAVEAAKRWAARLIYVAGEELACSK